MPFFRGSVFQDAYVRHECVVEASSPEEAASAVYDAWKGRREDIVLVAGDTQGFDHADEIDPSECEEITESQFKEELANNKKDDCYTVFPNDETGRWDVRQDGAFLCALESESMARAIAAAMNRF